MVLANSYSRERFRYFFAEVKAVVAVVRPGSENECRMKDVEGTKATTLLVDVI